MKRGPVQGEASVIREYFAPLAAGYSGAFGLLDDCAAFTPAVGHDLIIKTDPIAAGVHFFADDPPEDIAWKALTVNVSDLAAKAAVPRAYVMALSFPEAPTHDWLAAFSGGLAAAQARLGLHLIGGDTDRRPGPLTVSITVLGEAPAGSMVRRATARPGDVIYVTGSLGGSAAGLVLRQDPGAAARWSLTTEEADAARARYLRPPVPRLELRDALRTYASAAMDISDGLAKDLGRMCTASGCGAIVPIADVPSDPAAVKAIAFDPQHWSIVLAGGDDYEILLTVPPDRAMAFEAAAKDAGCRASPPFAVTRIGTMTEGSALVFQSADGQPFILPQTGWDHF